MTNTNWVNEIGYTHYTYRAKKFDSVKFKKVVSDFKVAVEAIKVCGVELAGGNGIGKAVITDKEICFNGKENCGHTKRNLGIMWPSKTAKGVALAVEHKQTVETATMVTMLCGTPEQLSLNDSDVSGQWFAGANLNSRTCGGDCSHETFRLECVYKPFADWDKPHGKYSNIINQDGTRNLNAPNTVGKYFSFCKTAYKPYDLAVIICLIIAKHYLGDAIIVHSDGEIENWSDGMEICQRLFGYGNDFKFDGDE